MSSVLTPDRASAIGKIGAYTTHSRHDVRDTTAAARAAFLDSFLEQVDPNRTLPEAERNRRAEAARKAHFARLALKSAEVRAERRGRCDAAAA